MPTRPCFSYRCTRGHAAQAYCPWPAQCRSRPGLPPRRRYSGEAQLHPQAYSARAQAGAAVHQLILQRPAGARLLPA
eukprot:16449223-Heterocapsa_arctica.AAC.1